MTIAYRKRGSIRWSHYFRVDPRRHNWRSFYAHARRCRLTMEYAYVMKTGEHINVL